jgi:hypothetical protein
MVVTETHEDFWKKFKPLVFKTIIGSIIAAALVGVLAVITGDFSTLSMRLIFTVLIIISFALLAWYDADVSSKRSHWFALIGVGVSIYLLLTGFLKIWLADGSIQNFDSFEGSYRQSDESAIWGGFSEWIGLLVVARFALLHAHLLLNIHRRYQTPILQIVARITMGFIAILAFLLSLPLLFPDVDYSEAYWRLVGAVVILDLLGTILIPISNALFRPRGHGDRRVQPVQQGYYQTPVAAPVQQNYYQASVESFEPPTTAPVQGFEAPVQQQSQFVTQPGQVMFEQPPTPSRRLAWPRYEDGTPLPVNADGTPDYSQVTRY